MMLGNLGHGLNLTRDESGSKGHVVMMLGHGLNLTLKTRVAVSVTGHSDFSLLVYGVW